MDWKLHEDFPSTATHLLCLAHLVTKVPKTTVDSQDNDVVDWELQLLVEPLPNQLGEDQRSFHRKKAHKV